MLMALLALGTYWLVRNTPMPGRARRPGARRATSPTTSCAVLGEELRARRRLRSELDGNEARHYPDTDTLEIDQVRMRSITRAARSRVATANRALTNGDGSEVQLFGNAVVMREAANGANGQAAAAAASSAASSCMPSPTPSASSRTCR